MTDVMQKNQAEVFAFVPSYNHAPFIEKCLRSIANQTLPPKKLLVIDDGSKDDSPKIIEKVLNECEFETELVVRENRGLCATLNEGFARSSGEYFAYIGSDDLWFPEFLEKRAALLEKRPFAVLAFGDAFLIDENDLIVDCTRDWTTFADGDLLPQLLRGQIFPSASVVYRRSHLAKYGWNEDSRLEDYELYLKLTADGEFAFANDVLCAWRQHKTNVSGNFPLMMREWIAAQNRAAEHLQISRAELDAIQSKLKFESVSSFVRYGDRRAAVKLFYENLSGAESIAQIGRAAFRLAVPAPLFNWNRRRKKLAAIKKYGKLEMKFDRPKPADPR